MKRLVCLFALLLPAAAFAADPPKSTVVAKDLPGILAICTTPDGRIFVGQDDGIYEVKGGKPEKLCDIRPYLNGLVAYQQWLFVSSARKVFRVELASGKSDLWFELGGISTIYGLAVDEQGTLSISVGDSTVYRVGQNPGPRGKPPTPDEAKKFEPGVFGGGMVMDGKNHLIGVHSVPRDGSLALHRLKVDDPEAKPTLLAAASTSKELGQHASITMDRHGRVFIVAASVIWAVPRPGEKFVKVADVTKDYYAITYHASTNQLLVADHASKSLLAIPAQIPGWEVDESPLIVEAAPAFTDVTWTGWDDGSASGKTNTFRPIVLTHAGDGSRRTFVATQHGVIHAIEKGAKEGKVFLDIQSKVLYRDDQNEQGLLGLAFHPDFKKNGEFFVFYTDKTKKLENVLSRFKVSKDDPSQADPASEQELLRISHKYWNHDGGTVCFGPDGYLYVVLGDGGSGGDPDKNGQNNKQLLGKILRIDINAKGENTPYAIPKDNPFVGKGGKDGDRPEIFATGVRNPWRLSFDRKTGQGWFGEVGQNLWEEVNLLEKGANYGWSKRESLHPFGPDGVGPSKEFTDPIWEYHHEVGKSITGGHVYRGKEVPGLDGYYLYADYVSTKVWGLRYDDKAKRVTANRPIAAPKLPWLSFGEDEGGELYLMTYSPTGKGIYKLKPGK